MTAVSLDPWVDVVEVGWGQIGLNCTVGGGGGVVVTPVDWNVEPIPIVPGHLHPPPSGTNTIYIAISAMIAAGRAEVTELAEIRTRWSATVEEDTALIQAILFRYKLLARPPETVDDIGDVGADPVLDEAILEEWPASAATFEVIVDIVEKTVRIEYP